MALIKRLVQFKKVQILNFPLQFIMRLNKQKISDSDSSLSSTGWETMLDGLLQQDFL